MFFFFLSFPFFSFSGSSFFPSLFAIVLGVLDWKQRASLSILAPTNQGPIYNADCWLSILYHADCHGDHDIRPTGNESCMKSKKEKLGAGVALTLSIAPSGRAGDR